jgi:cell division protein FtsB
VKLHEQYVKRELEEGKMKKEGKMKSKRKRKWLKISVIVSAQSSRYIAYHLSSTLLDFLQSR